MSFGEKRDLQGCCQKKSVLRKFSLEFEAKIKAASMKLTVVALKASFLQSFTVSAEHTLPL